MGASIQVDTKVAVIDGVASCTAARSGRAICGAGARRWSLPGWRLTVTTVEDAHYIERGYENIIESSGASARERFAAWSHRGKRSQPERRLTAWRAENFNRKSQRASQRGSPGDALCNFAVSFWRFFQRLLQGRLSGGVAAQQGVVTCQVQPPGTMMAQQHSSVSSQTAKASGIWGNRNSSRRKYQADRCRSCPAEIALQTCLVR